MLEVGQQSPKMEYITDQGETKEISTRGVKTWVVFFPFAFTGTCTAEVCDIRDNAQNYESPDTNYVFVTCDPAPSQKHGQLNLVLKALGNPTFILMEK
jgi:peroxiredoxin